MLEEQVNDYSLLRDFKYDSLLIESELQEYVNKQNQEEHLQRIAEGKQLLGELEAVEKTGGLGVTPTKGSTGGAANKDQLEKIFNETELPSWARTKEPGATESKTAEKKPMISGKWLNRAPEAEVEPETETEVKVEEPKKDSPKPKEVPLTPPPQTTTGGAESDVEEPEPQVQPQPQPQINLGHGVQIRSATPEQQIVEDIPEDHDYKDSFEELVDEKIESLGDFGNPEEIKTEEDLEKSKFIEQNYENLDEEAPASPERLPGVKSISKVFWQSKSLTKEDSKVPQKNSDADIEIQLQNEDEALESQGVIKYKDPSLRESLFDVNAIKNQVSNVSKTLESLEQQLATSKDGNKLPKNFAYFDQSRNFTSTFDIDEQSQREEVIAPTPQPITEQILNPQPTQQKSPSPIRTPEKSQPTVVEDNKSGSIKIDKKNLVPTTLEQLAKKQTTPPPQDVLQKVLSPASSSKEKEAESPNELTVKSEKEESKPNRFTLQPPGFVEPEGTFTGKRTPSPGPMDQRSSPFGGSEQVSTIQMGTEWDSDPVSLSYGTSAFYKPQQFSTNPEAEIEESFNLIKAHLSKIDSIMRNSVYEKDSRLRDRLADKFEKQYDETRRSVDSLGVRSSRSGSAYNSNDVSQSMISNASNMSDFVLANSKDLLENYSKMLLQTFEQQLAAKLKK